MLYSYFDEQTEFHQAIQYLKNYLRHLVDHILARRGKHRLRHTIRQFLTYLSFLPVQAIPYGKK